jgi:hypothetical protein
VPGVGFNWGIEAASVGQVLAAEQVPDVPVADIEAILGVPSQSDPGPQRVLAVGAAQGFCFVRTGGRISIRIVDRAAVCALPKNVLRGKSGRVLSGVVFGEGDPPLLIVDVEGLWAVNAERQASEAR